MKKIAMTACTMTLLGSLFGRPALAAEKLTLTSATLSTDAALTVARAALADCRRQGFVVAVAVVDRAGIPLALLRDNLAGPHTPETAVGKAWTAVSFRTDTVELARATQPGQASSGLRSVPRFTAVGGGVPIQAAGSVIGGIGVSGAPSGEADDACAKAGIASVQDELEM